MLLLPLTGSAISLSQVRFHDEQNDTTRITELLINAEKIGDPNQRIAWIAKEFIDRPYVAHTLEGEPEMLTVNLDQLDCTTFVETVMALAFTAGEGRTSWRDFIFNLEKLRYRNGQLNGYPSRLHYISDWIVNNSHRGNFKEVTSDFPSVSYAVKTLNFMSSNRKSYPALKSDDNFMRIKDVEMGYRQHRFPYIKWGETNDKKVIAEMLDGDILAFTCNLKNLDVTHMGILTMVDGTPHVLHASLSAKKVTISKYPLHEYLRRNGMTGIRIIRLSH